MQISCGGQAPGKAGIDFFSFVSNNTFSGNIARFAGGGISVFGANVKIASNTFTNNNPDFPTNPDRWYDPNDVGNSLTGVYGGAIHLETHQGIGGNRNFQIVGNTITGNKARSQGGGILLYLENTTCSVLISGNKIISNRAEYPGKIYTSPAVVDPYGGQKMGQGGGLLISAPSKNFSTGVTTPNNSVITVSGNTINANTAQDFAAGQFSGGKYSIRNNTVDSNTAIFRHGGLVFQMNGDLNISGNSVKNNKVADIYKNGVSDRAGGIYVADLRDTTGLMANNTFTNNRGRLAGAVYLSKSVGRLDLTGNTFTNNVTVARDDKGRAISGSFTADGGSVVPSGVATVVSSNTFIGDVFGLSFFNYTTPKINVSNNAFSSSTSGVARAKLNGGLTMDYLTVNALNATAFASGNTGTP